MYCSAVFDTYDFTHKSSLKAFLHQLSVYIDIMHWCLFHGNKITIVLTRLKDILVLSLNI